MRGCPDAHRTFRGTALLPQKVEWRSHRYLSLRGAFFRSSEGQGSFFGVITPHRKIYLAFVDPLPMFSLKPEQLNQPTEILRARASAEAAIIQRVRLMTGCR